MQTEYKGRTIEIIKPANQYAACAFTVNGQGQRSGERFTGNLGQSAADVLAMVRDAIDQRDGRGITGPNEPHNTLWMRPGSYEVCPAKFSDHVKPVGAPCLDERCIRDAAKKAKAKTRRSQGHPSVAALTVQLKKNHPHYGGNGPKAGFRVTKTEGPAKTGVHVSWYRQGGNMPIDSHPGEMPEIAAEIEADGRFTVLYRGGCTAYVVSKTHGEMPHWA